MIENLDFFMSIGTKIKFIKKYIFFKYLGI